MRTPKNAIRADAKKNRILDTKEIEKEVGSVTILARQILWGNETTTRTICVYRTGAVREPWEDGYEEDIETYHFTDADAANKKYIELINKYSK